MNNVFISSVKKNEVVENFVKNKREELEKMVPNFVDDMKFTDIVLNFYERGIRDGAQMMLGNLYMKEVDLDRAIDKWIDDAAITHEDCSITDIISTAKHFFELGIKSKGE